LDHFTNIPAWLRDFFQMVPDFHINDCTRNYINGKLDALHQRQDYQGADMNIQRAMELKTLAYNSFFGFFGCATNEQGAENGSAAWQFSLGVLHEFLNSLDYPSIE